MANVDRLSAFYGSLSAFALVLGSILPFALAGFGVVLGSHCNGDILLFSLQGFGMMWGGCRASGSKAESDVGSRPRLILL